MRRLPATSTAGEAFGFLAFHGSGKTALRALQGTHQPTAGTMHISGTAFWAAVDAGEPTGVRHVRMWPWPRP